MSEKKSYRLNKDVTAHIAQLLQLAIVTGTDITDMFGAVRLVEGGEDTLSLDPEYLKKQEAEIVKLAEKAQELAKDSAVEDAMAEKNEQGFIL